MTTKVTAKVLAADAATEIQIAAGAVNYTEIAAGALRTVHYGNLSIPSSAYGTGSVPTAAHADRSITSIKIGLNQVIAEHYGNLSIPSTAYGTGSIPTAAHADRAITSVKIGLNQVINENLADGAVTGRVIGAGVLLSTHYTNNTIAPARLVNGAVGDFIVGGEGGVFTVLTKGAENSVMAIKNGIPTWTSSILSTGMMNDFLGTVAPTGWILANGRTIGNASSGGSERANVDCYALFALLWANFSDTICPVSSGRGVTADADWAANKTITLPDLRGRATVAADAMNNSEAGRLTSAAATPSGTTLGATGGTQTVTLTETQIPPHSHSILEYVGNNPEPADISSPEQSILSRGGGGNIAYSLRTGTGSANTGKSSTYGAGAAFSNMPPFFVVNKIIKL